MAGASTPGPEITSSSIPGTAGFVLETSTDLITWTPRQTTTATPEGAWSFTDASQPLTIPRLFTRVRQQ